MTKKKSPTSALYERNTALCYIRQSYTRDEDDTSSPERQRANILAVCERNGWTPEWYEDVGGHKSGRYETNRPKWLALKARLGDPDVIALVANDLSRLHRKGWRVGDLIECINKNNINLALAAPGREVDTTTSKGRMFLQFGALIDEYYAEDISQRAKDSIAYRKRQGKSIGLPPFGTTRNSEGYICPSLEGAWLLKGGQWVAGKLEQCPEDEALWKSYYDAAQYTLQIYAHGDIGLDRIAYQLNEEGWAFRDRSGQPRPFARYDIRRIVANWPEYGGLIPGTRSKDRPAYENYNADEIVFNEERAIFPISLLRIVAKVRQGRTIRPIDQSVKRISHPYPLSGITYCAQCEQKAKELDNPKFRTVISGNSYVSGVMRYRHKPGVSCTCKNRSVPCDILENEFSRLLTFLTVNTETLDVMTELAIQVDKVAHPQKQEIDPEVEKQEAITLCRRKIDAAVILFGDGMIDKDEYRRRVEQNEREIAHWEARTSDTQKIALELAMCMEAVDRLSRLWDISSDEDKRGLVRSLFTEVAFDLDTHRITGFKLKAWADRFIVLRSSLYDENNLAGNDTNRSGDVSNSNDITELLRGGTVPFLPNS